jgi:glycosyltransferase involved in cell wall biosynthesis
VKSTAQYCSVQKVDLPSGTVKAVESRRLLMVAYYYPPLGGIGSQRSQKFARHLPRHGWQPIVLTPDQGVYFVDRELDDGISAGATVVRTKAIQLSAMLRRASRLAGADVAPVPDPMEIREPGGAVGRARRFAANWLYIPDGQIGWLPYAVQAGRRLIESHEVAAIYSTSFPITAHVAAYRLKRATGIPWVADFRDLWTENHYDNTSSRLRKRLDRMIERRLLAGADALVTVSETWAEALRRLSGGTKRVEVIRNGFDPDDFAEAIPPEPSRWTLTYVGSFYGSRQDPSPIFDALSRLVAAGAIPRSEVNIDLVGPRDEYVQKRLEDFGLASAARWTGFVSHAESVRHQKRSHLLLLIIPSGEPRSGLIPGKLYEYLGAGRKILAIIPDHFEAARIIRETGVGVIASPANAKIIEACLLESYSHFRDGATPETSTADLTPYTRPTQARQLAELLNDVVAREPSV